LIHAKKKPTVGSPGRKQVILSSKAYRTIPGGGMFSPATRRRKGPLTDVVAAASAVGGRGENPRKSLKRGGKRGPDTAKRKKDLR